MKFDSEDLLDTILTCMTSGGALNAKIVAIEAEKIAASKGVTPTLAQVDSTGYFAQTWSNDILNLKGPAIFYGIANCEANENAGAIAKTYTIFVSAVLTDSGNAKDLYKRSLRYSRALEELFNNKFAPSLASGNVKIKSVDPISFQNEFDSNNEVNISGISLTITLV